MLAFEGGLAAATSARGVHIFRRGDGAWMRVAVLESDSREENDPREFGSALAVAADTVAVAEEWFRVAGRNVGALHVYEPKQASWERAALLHLVPPSGCGLPTDLSLDATMLMVASHEFTDDLQESCAFYAFDRDGTGWSPPTRRTSLREARRPSTL